MPSVSFPARPFANVVVPAIRPLVSVAPHTSACSSCFSEDVVAERFVPPVTFPSGHPTQCPPHSHPYSAVCHHGNCLLQDFLYEVVNSSMIYSLLTPSVCKLLLRGDSNESFFHRVSGTFLHSFFLKQTAQCYKSDIRTGNVSSFPGSWCSITYNV